MHKVLSSQEPVIATASDWPLLGLREVVNRAQESLLANAQTIANYTELFFAFCVMADSIVTLLESMYWTVLHFSKTIS